MAHSSATNAEPDLALIAELSEEAERHPPAIGAKTLLVQHYISIGWNAAASDLLRELQRVAPQDAEVLSLAELVGKNTESAPAVEARASEPEKSAPKQKGKSGSFKKMADLVDGYRELRAKTQGLLSQLLRLQDQQKKVGLPKGGVSARVQSIIDEENGSEKEIVAPPSKLPALRRMILSFPEKVVEVVIADLEDHCGWMRHNGQLDKDHLRDSSFRRLESVKTGLPEALQVQSDLAWMQVERKLSTKPYANTVTMLLHEPIASIPQEDFFVTEDSWAWDMSELAQAITAHGGVMRNPETGEMFSPQDIRNILAHPQGKHLAALRIAQEQMFQGVRPETITRMETLADTMEGERGTQWDETWEAIRGFQAYIATLPENEQKTINHYKCPVAFDDHARKAYDITVGQTLRDVGAATMCVHKGGDFLRQAAAHLKSRRGVGHEEKKGEEGCVVM